MANYNRKSTEAIFESRGFVKTGTTALGASVYEITKRDSYGIDRTFTAHTYDYGCKFFAPDSEKGKLYQASPSMIAYYIEQSAGYYDLAFNPIRTYTIELGS